ncbi:hypothetical protein [Flavisolibacter nicotianae]|uniref:hypothetical protein n=1 Tax=Flavisolibacter nicotianae TaxID=2364882 RepID=UPI000EAFD3DF|nr:hypothetical protein [Flavisolibacter nicotianae]
MKKQLISNSTKSSMIRFSAAILLFMSLTKGYAATPNKGDEPFVDVKYVGLADQRAQFQFDLLNDNEEAYLLTIQEEDGTVLYREKIAKKVFSKKFEWNNADHNASKLIFTVTGEKSKKAQVFEVNSQVRTVQDVVIKKH